MDPLLSRRIFITDSHPNYKSLQEYVNEFYPTLFTKIESKGLCISSEYFRQLTYKLTGEIVIRFYSDKSKKTRIYQISFNKKGIFYGD